MSRSTSLYGFNFRVAGEKHHKIVESYLLKLIAVEDFITPVPLFYIIKSKLNSSELAEELSFLFPDGNFIIFSLDLNDVNGIITNNYWDWIYNRNSTAGWKSNRFPYLLGPTI